MSSDSSTSLIFATPTPTLQENDSRTDAWPSRRRTRPAKQIVTSFNAGVVKATSSSLSTDLIASEILWRATGRLPPEAASTEPTLGFRREHLPVLVEQLYREPVSADEVEAMLRKIFSRYGEGAVMPVANLCLRSGTSDELVEGIANAVARFAGSSLETSALQLLLELLSSERTIVREIALMALDFMHDKRAIGALQRAAARESSNSLKPIFASVLGTLNVKA